MRCAPSVRRDQGPPRTAFPRGTPRVLCHSCQASSGGGIDQWKRHPTWACDRRASFPSLARRAAFCGSILARFPIASPPSTALTDHGRRGVGQAIWNHAKHLDLASQPIRPPGADRRIVVNRRLHDGIPRNEPVGARRGGRYSGVDTDRRRPGPRSACAGAVARRPCAHSLAFFNQASARTASRNCNLIRPRAQSAKVLSYEGVKIFQEDPIASISPRHSPRRLAGTCRPRGPWSPAVDRRIRLVDACPCGHSGPPHIDAHGSQAHGFPPGCVEWG